MKNIPFPYSAIPFPLKILDKYIPAKISYHLKILLFAIVVELITYLSAKKDIFSEQGLYSFILLVCFMQAFMIAAYFVFRRNVNYGETRKKISIAIIKRYFIFYLLCLIASFIIFIIFLYFLYWIKGWDLQLVMHNFFHFEFKGWFKSINQGLFIGTFIFVIVIWQDALKQTQKFKEEKLIFQYETLKSQVNPHFLFNSLNTLSSLITSNTELADQFVHKLSSIYRYVIENSEIDLIELSSEIAFVNNYFYLQQIRDENKISLIINAPETDNYKILPMSLQILVENALKHNSATRENPLKIQIVQKDETMYISNNLQKKSSIGKSTGTGLKNLAERTKFIVKQEIQIIETANEYTVVIPLITS